MALLSPGQLEEQNYTFCCMMQGNVKARIFRASAFMVSPSGKGRKGGPIPSGFAWNPAGSW